MGAPKDLEVTGQGPPHEESTVIGDLTSPAKPERTTFDASQFDLRSTGKS